MPPKNRCNSGSDSDGPTHPRKRVFIKDEDEYREKRDRNNVAVRKSRERSRQKAKETIEKVNRLKQENEDLEMRVKLLSKELNLLKDLFLGHASGGMDTQCPGDSTPMLTVKTENTESAMNSSGETDNSVDSIDSNFTAAYDDDQEAGTLVNAEAVQKDHEYSVPAKLRVQ